MTEADQPRVTDKQHQADAGDSIYVDKRKLADIKIAQAKWRDQGDQDKQPVPESLAVVLEMINVLSVACFE